MRKRTNIVYFICWLNFVRIFVLLFRKNSLFIISFNFQNIFSEYSITGSTYEPLGQILHSGIQINRASDDHKALTELATICSMCNNSSVDYNEVFSSYFIQRES